METHEGMQTQTAINDTESAEINTVGFNIKRLRLKRDLSQVDLAYHLGIKQSMISSYENGRNSPTLKGLKKMADFFEVPIDALFKEPSESAMEQLNRSQDVFSSKHKKPKKPESKKRKRRSGNKSTAAATATKRRRRTKKQTEDTANTTK